MLVDYIKNCIDLSKQLETTYKVIMSNPEYVMDFIYG